MEVNVLRTGIKEIGKSFEIRLFIVLLDCSVLTSDYLTYHIKYYELYTNGTV